MSSSLRAWIAAALCALALQCAAGCSVEVDTEYLKAVSALTKADHIEPLDPDVYKPQIDAIETDLYAPPRPFTDEERTRLTGNFDALGKRILVADPAPLAQVFGREMIVFGKRLSNTGDPLARSRLAAREQWRRIRGSLFEDAAWFR